MVIGLMPFSAAGCKPDSSNSTDTVSQNSARISYADAQKDEKVRQAYLDQLVREEFPNGLPKYVKSVTYIPNDKVKELELDIRPDSHMQTKFDFSQFSQIGKRELISKVYVLQRAFEDLQNEASIKNSLFNHEFVHGEQFYEGLPGLPPFEGDVRIGKEVFDIVAELSAYTVEMSRQQERNLPVDYTRRTAGTYLNYYSQLWTTKQIFTDYDRDALKLHFFRPWMESYVADGPDGKLYLSVAGKNNESLAFPLPSAIRRK